MTHSKRQINGWKGERATERFDISQVTDKELVEMLSKEVEAKGANDAAGV